MKADIERMAQQAFEAEAPPDMAPWPELAEWVKDDWRNTASDRVALDIGRQVLAGAHPLIASLTACAHALRLQLGIRYQRLGLDDPANRAAYEADMEPVQRAEALLAEFGAQKSQSTGHQS